MQPGACLKKVTGFTKRPALMDPLDRVDGWPTVRGGAWTHALPRPRIALVAMGGGGDFTAEFDYVRVHALRTSPQKQ